MRLLKVVTNIFKTKGQYSESKLEFEVEKPPEEIFDDAVQEVYRKKIKEVLKEQLTEMCYEPKVVLDTRGAEKEFGLNSCLKKEIKEKYPNANFYLISHGIYSVLGLKFDVDKFLDRVLNEAGL